MRKIEKNPGAVYFGSNSWNVLQKIISDKAASTIAILVDQNTKKHCLPSFLKEILFNKTPHILEIQAGESHKTIATCLKVWEALSQKGFDRKSLLINLGGGVVTDLGGFVASTYMRGIDCINIPTTLLAMVDAAVGGKNGVDLGVLKNQIGVIRDPLAVIVDTQFLTTLPDKEVSSGYAEMLKHGLIASKDYWSSLQDFEVSNHQKTEDLVWESILIKNEIVTEDQREQGIRKTLNFGHTLGHAIESYCLKSSHMPTLLHGESIAIGMILALYISTEITGLSKEIFRNTSKTLLTIGEKVQFTNDDISEIIKLLKHDKKNVSGQILFVLLKDLGVPVINKIIEDQLIKESFVAYAKI